MGNEKQLFTVIIVEPPIYHLQQEIILIDMVNLPTLYIQ
jgi:hypothetical protein